MNLLGPRLKELRAASGKTQEEVALGAQMTPQMLSNLERGKGDPQLSTIRKLAAYYHISLSDMFSEKMPPPPKPREPTPAEVAVFVLGNMKVTEAQRAVILAVLEHPEKAERLRVMLSKNLGTA
jgi:transcriptional regulator with XRE-family HTH domain